MEKKLRHYKFKALRSIVSMGISFPLRYSVWNHVGLLLILVSLITSMNNQTDVNGLAIFTGLTGLLMGRKMIADIYNNYTIKD